LLTRHLTSGGQGIHPYHCKAKDSTIRERDCMHSAHISILSKRKRSIRGPGPCSIWIRQRFRCFDAARRIGAAAKRNRSGWRGVDEGALQNNPKQSNTRLCVPETPFPNRPESLGRKLGLPLRNVWAAVLCVVFTFHVLLFSF
jgi:hypothetical protein